jgi:hypothetical protein
LVQLANKGVIFRLNQSNGSTILRENDIFKGAKRELSRFEQGMLSYQQ